MQKLFENIHFRLKNLYLYSRESKVQKMMNTYFPEIEDYQKKLKIFASNLVESAYYLIWKNEKEKNIEKMGNVMLFGKSSKRDKKKAVRLVYDTWLKYGNKICDVLPKILKKAMEKLKSKDMEKVRNEYKDADKKVNKNAIWNFPDDLPVFDELQKVVTANAELFKKEWPCKVVDVNDGQDYRNKIRFLRD